MDRGNYEWATRPPNVRERIIAGIWLAAMTTALANQYAGWRLFGPYDRQVAAGLAVLGLVLFLRFLPGVKRKPE